MQKLRDGVTDAVDGLLVDGDPAQILIGLGWPDVERLQDVARGKLLISIHNRQTQRIPMRYISKPVSKVKMPCGITATLSNDSVEPSGDVTLTLAYSDGSSAVNLNDGVGLGAFFAAIDEGATAISGATETLSSLAEKLADSINDRDVLSDWISASATDEVVTITNLQDQNILLRAAVGNRSIRTTETARQQADLQITLWANSEKSRYTVGDVLESYFGKFERFPRLEVAASDRALVSYGGQLDSYDDTQKDVYRRDFMLSAEYSLRYQDIAYPILVGIHRHQYVNELT